MSHLLWSAAVLLGVVGLLACIGLLLGLADTTGEAVRAEYDEP